MTQHKKIYGALILLTGVLSTVTVLAAPKQESANQQAFKKAQGVVRQLTEDNQALTTEKTALQAQVTKLEALIKQLEPLQTEVQLHKTQADTLRQGNSTLSTQLSGERDKLQQLQQKLKTIVADAKLIQADNQLLVNAVNERERWIKQCTVKNTQLIKTNHDVIDSYQARGFWDKVAELEPFTGIAKVESQNTQDSYQFKLEDLKVTDFATEANTPH